LFVTGRESELVKKGGEFISLPMIENVALRCTEIADAAAAAVPDEYWGSRLVLFYSPRQGASMEHVEGRLKDLLVDGLRKIEQPDKLIAVPWMPKTSIGKIIRRELVERYAF
jgi:acyl-CoA synthetase (AMP-forming)/AMP-acid ligase II